MQIVIDIDENVFTRLFDNGIEDYAIINDDLFKIAKSIRKGTPLPKGHGRLIDVNYLLSILKCEEYETCTWRNCSDCNREKCIRRHMILDAPIIIEAYKAEIEPQESEVEE